jgi:hypothetical protein
VVRLNVNNVIIGIYDFIHQVVIVLFSLGIPSLKEETSSNGLD